MSAANRADAFPSNNAAKVKTFGSEPEAEDTMDVKRHQKLT
jgi:hypothetical protein